MMFFKPKNAAFPEERLFNEILLHSPDGTGVLTLGKVRKWVSETYPEEFRMYEGGDALLLHARTATRGTLSKSNVQPFSDERLPGLWFAHSGTMAYVPDHGMTDSEFFFKTILVPMIREVGTAGLLGKKHDMRTAGSRFILWSGKPTDLPLFYGVWFLRKGVYYSSYVSDSKEVGILDRWWRPDAI